MAKMIVELEWNDELGPLWMNMDNLKILLYGQMYTKPELLNITLVDHSDLQYKEYSIGKPEDYPCDEVVLENPSEPMTWLR
jgi:hypothetical protein